MTHIEQQIVTAWELGREAFRSKIAHTSGDLELNKLLDGESNQKERKRICNAWMTAWDEEYKSHRIIYTVFDYI